MNNSDSGPAWWRSSSASLPSPPALRVCTSAGWCRPAPVPRQCGARGSQGHHTRQIRSSTRGKDDTIDAENAAHAAFAQIRTVTPKTRDGMVVSLRVLQATRETAV